MQVSIRKLKWSQTSFYFEKNMRGFFLLFLLFSSLFLTASIFAINQVKGQSQDTYSLQLQGFVWNHPTLNALVIPADNESWWNPNYLKTVLRAIGQWDDAITAFASNNSNFSYLSSLSIQPTVSNISQPGFDIYINWTDSALSNSSDVSGLTQIYSSYRKTIINSTITLATQTKHGGLLNEVDMQNVALHELGHSLGLGHANYTGDLMYSTYTTRNSAKAVSSLDVYGVATLFAWELNETNFYPINDWLDVNSVILPSEIAYQGLPVLPENASPQTFANNSVVQFLVIMFETLIHTDILAIVLVIALILAIIVLISKKQKQSRSSIVTH
jgi:Matrixin